MRVYLKRLSISVITIIILLSQMSCVNLEGLKKFTDSSVEAGKKFKALSQDPYRNCAIRVYYQEIKNKQFKKIIVFDSPDSYLKIADDVDRKNCEDIKTNWKNFQEANKILVSYLYVMGTLAADDIANTDTQFDAIKKHVSTLSGGDPYFKAVLGVANTITNILLDAKRRNGIRKAILNANGDVTTVTNGLSNALDVYISALGREKEDLISLYEEGSKINKEFSREVCCQNRADKCKNADGSDISSVCVFSFNDALGILSSRNAVETNVQIINAKIDSVKAYQKILKEIRDGHNELFQEAQKGFDDKQAIKIALKYAPAIQENFDELSAAF